ncbi:DNA recombination protein RmuC [Nakamurella silvestris]|nr:DNA recombination protein RmuC [Nakamurella silvestris]
MDTSSLIWALALLLVGLALGFYLGRANPAAKAAPEERADAIAVGALLAPAADALVRVEGQLREIERERVGSYTALREQVAALHRTSAELGQQTRSLAGALRSPQIRGRWGELQLQRIVELAGMTEHCDFDTQVTVGSGDNLARPDLVVRLSGGRTIPVDSKVPFNAWLQALDSEESGTGADSQGHLQAHARAVRHHVDQLAQKAYWRHFQPSPEFVVMFIPGEPLLDAALSRDPGLTEYAFSKNVVIATPTTLITLLRTVAYSWRQEKLGSHAELIHQLGRDLHGRLATMGSHLTKLGLSLTRSVEAYNASVSSIESRVLVTARKLTDLGVSQTRLDEIEQIDRMPRYPQAAEFAEDTATG